jgi:integrase
VIPRLGKGARQWTPRRATKTRPVLLTLSAQIDITNADEVRDQITAGLLGGPAQQLECLIRHAPVVGHHDPLRLLDHRHHIRCGLRAVMVTARLRQPKPLAKPPRVEEAEVDPFEVEETERVLALALRKRNGVRFVIALALGLRQGEALALKWPRLHEPSKTLEIMKGLQRQTWQHGCADPHACGARYHKTKPCPKNCNRHHRQCPPPCPPDCASHAGWCPQRHGGGLVEVEVKSTAGRRGIALPDQLFDLIIEHRARQDQEREHAGTEWHEGGWLFAQPTGKPIDPRRDQYEWKALLKEAGVREARLHDARHTAATTLLLLGVPERAVMDIMGWSNAAMDIMGWSNAAMVKRYAHVTARLRRDIAERLNVFLWSSNETKNETNESTQEP